MYKQTSKFELNLINTKEPPTNICSAAIKYRATSIVIDNPLYIPAMLATRMSTNGRWKLILAVDFPLGKEYGFSNKFKNLTSGAFACDGFDVLLSARNEVETANEIKSILDQVKQINQMIEIRFVIDAFSRDIKQVTTILSAIKRTPPAKIRLDHHIALPHLDDNKIDEVVKLVREYTAVPMNLSTNVTLGKITKYANTFDTFGVDLKTAFAVEKEINAQP